MSPRPYRSPGREASAAETRARILAAARALLSEGEVAGFTVEAVAARADVARATVYNQFGSKRGLVEALSDDLAGRGGMGRLHEAVNAGDPRQGVRRLIEVFTDFWASDPQVIRRLRALTLIDPELARGARDIRRRGAIGRLLRRHAAATGRPGPADLEAATDLLLALTSFETYESLAADRTPAAVVAILAYAAGRLLS